MEFLPFSKFFIKYRKNIKMKSIHQWLTEYGESHQNKTNKTIHWVCVPTIFFSVLGLLYSIKLPFSILGIQGNVGVIILVLVIIYYISLSKTLWIGMLLFASVCLVICYGIEKSGILPLWAFCLILFVAAWVGQFYGHKIEGKKPSFLKDIQFLMMGPAWLMSFIYKKLGVAL
jgi:uncharacterized membrane protein YGL010W